MQMLFDWFDWHRYPAGFAFTESMIEIKALRVIDVGQLNISRCKIEPAQLSSCLIGI
jgi:hypothetical protein